MENATTGIISIIIIGQSCPLCQTVNCSILDCSSCIKSRQLKSCDSISIDHKGSKQPKSKIVCLPSVIYLSFVIYINWFVQISNVEVNVDYEEQEALFSNDEGYFRIINLLEATEHLHDEYIIGEGGHEIVYKAELDIGIFAIKNVKFVKSNRRKSNMIREIEMTTSYVFLWNKSAIGHQLLLLHLI
ncbi:hypothetical protein K1719_030792 [Acacia pycnantha]|nr:hypothetical protein K1719_030792 [Acacia pycnantha]